MSNAPDCFDVDPHTNPVLHVALERIRASLGITDDFANGIIVKQIIELAKDGDDPDQLCESALSKLREHLFGD